MNTKQLQVLLLFSTLWHPVLLWDVEFLLGYILPLTTMLQHQEVNWFISEGLSTEDSENLEYFMHTIHTKTFITQTIMTNNTDVRVTTTANKRNYIGIILTTGPDDYILTVHDKVLKGRHSYLNFVILVRRTDDFRIVEKVLYVLQKNNFEMIFLYVGYTNGTSDLYGVTAFPETHIEKRTDLFSYLQSMMGKFINGGWDCMGFKYKTPLRQDVPFVFKYRDRENNTVLRGSSYKIMELFLEVVNASMEEYPMPPDPLGGDAIDMRSALNLVRDGEVQLLGHSYALFTSDDYVEQSYPIMVVKWCLMVPLWNTASPFYYPIKPFDHIVWYAVVITFFVLSITDCLWIVCENLRHSGMRRDIMRWHLRESVLENFCFIINIAASRTIKNPSVMRFLFYAAVWFHGFFLSANYTSLLGSILTVTLFREQINTIEDLIRVNVSVMIIDYEYDFLMSRGLNLPKEFLKLILKVDSATFNQHQLNLNKTYAYFVTDDKWRFLDMQQKHLKQRGLFKLTEICFGSYILGFPIKLDMPLRRTMEYFMRSIQFSGLLEYYENSAFENALQAGLVQRFNADTEYTSAQLEHVMMIFYMLLNTYIFSTLIFLGECGYYWLNMKLKRRRRQVN